MLAFDSLAVSKRACANPTGRRWAVRLACCAWWVLAVSAAAQDVETIRLDQPRPDWIQNQAAQANDNRVVVIATAQCPTRVEARRALDAAIRDRIAEHLEFSLPDQPLGTDWFDAAYVNQHIIGAGHKVIVQELVEPELMEHLVELTPDMKLAYRGYARLQLDDALTKHVLDQRREQLAWNRVKHWGLGYLALIGGIAIVFCYLRMESLTRHHYSHRIQLLAVLLAVLLLALVIRLLNT